MGRKPQGDRSVFSHVMQNLRAIDKRLADGWKHEALVKEIAISADLPLISLSSFRSALYRARAAKAAKQSATSKKGT